MSRPSIRWILYGTALALTLAGVRIVDQPGDRVAAARVRADPEPPRAATAAKPEVAAVPSLELERLALRAQRETAADPFDARSWETLAAEEARRNAPPPPPPPRAPPLPFTFLGKLIDGDQVTVFLTNGTRNWVVRVGDTIDGAYRVDAIGAERMTLTYLALAKPQELAFGEALPSLLPISATATAAALPPPVPSASAAPLTGQVALLLAAPSRVTAGNELIVNLALPPGGGARRARVALAFDPQVLAAVGAPASDAGRVTVELTGDAAPLAQVRFRVVAQSPTTTRIGVEEATATDAHGASLSIAAPGAHSVAIVRAGG